MKSNYRFQWYQRIFEAIPKIMAEAEAAGRKLGLQHFKGEIGMYPGASSCPGRLPSFVLDPIIESNRGAIQPMRGFHDQLREVVKDIYGDDYDAAATNSCESALRLVNEALFAPPTLRKGDAYRARVITPLTEDFEYLGGYGRPFPPKYKAIMADRSVSSGEFGVEAKALVNQDTVFARLAGGRYEIHGVRQNIVPLLSEISVDGSMSVIRRLAERHAANLTGFQCVGYDTPSYGLSERNAQGGPRLLSEISKLAAEYDVPHFVDVGGGLPVVGYGPREVGASVMSWSMDKAGRAPISGLVVGREEDMLHLRRALGTAGQRYGETTSHGKALYAFADPGRDAMIGLIAYLKTLRDTPKRITDPIDQYHELIVAELKDFPIKRFREGFLLTKTPCFGGTEINYERTWKPNAKPGEYGIPIFTLEDLFANSSAIPLAMEAMGVAPATVYAGKMFMTPGLGTIDTEGRLIADRAQLAVKAMVQSLEIVCRHAGLGD
jgi:hypothetical protein